MNFMITKLDRKRQQERLAKERAMFHKVLFLSILFMLIVGLGMFSQHQTSSTPLKRARTKAVPTLSIEDIPSVLGEQIAEKSEDLQIQLEGGVKLADRYRPGIEEQISSQAGRLLEEGKKNIEDTLIPIIYSRTLDPIIKQVNTLPNSQQRYIKQQLCTDGDLLRED